MSEVAPDVGGTDSTTERTSGGRAIGIAFGTTVAAFALTLVAGIVFLIPLLIYGVDVESTEAFVVLTVAGQLGFLVVGYAVARWRGMTIPIERPTGRQLGIALGATLLALVLAIVLTIVLDALGLLPGSVIGEAGMQDPNLLLYLGALSIVLVAPAEEFVFRGVVQGTLREAFGPVPAVVGASLLFGSLHLANYSGRPFAILAGALLIAATGAVLGTVYEYTKNLTVPIAVHALYNTILFSLAYLTM